MFIGSTTFVSLMFLVLSDPIMSERSTTSSVKKHEKKIVESLSRRTHFSSQEIERLLRLYRLTVVVFLGLLGLQ